MIKESKVEYSGGSGDDGYGFFPVITCHNISSQGKKRLRWALYHPREQYKTKDDAVAAAEARIEVIFDDREDLVAAPDRFAGHLRARGFTDLKSFVLARNFEDDRRTALGPAYQPAWGDEAAASDPELHAKVIEIVEAQLTEGKPEETRRTFERLIALGNSPELTKRLIGLCVAHELLLQFVFKKPFDEVSYAANLQKLPEVPDMPGP
jgi:hypothetical protein